MNEDQWMRCISSWMEKCHLSVSSDERNPLARAFAAIEGGEILG